MTFVTEEVAQRKTNSLEQFHTLVLENYSLQERLKTATDQESFVELVVELGKEVDCFFTKEDVLSAITEGDECVVLSDGDVLDSIVARGMPDRLPIPSYTSERRRPPRTPPNSPA